MIDDKPSRTAQFVAATRALGIAPARRRAAHGRSLRRARGARRRRAAGGAVAAAAVAAAALARRGGADAADDRVHAGAHAAHRRRACAPSAASAARRWCSSAPASTRARRACADVLDGARVFEVDHPATQALKRARFGDLRRHLRAVGLRARRHGHARRAAGVARPRCDAPDADDLGGRDDVPHRAGDRRLRRGGARLVGAGLAALLQLRRAARRSSGPS